MLQDYELVPETIIRSHSFAGLITLYESNYLRLLQLVPELRRLTGYYRSSVAGDLDLHVEILDRSRYTVTLSLSHHFLENGVRVAEPDMHIRVYFDGQLAEAMSFAGEHGHLELRRLRRDHRHELDDRWRRNTVLNKWLDYLIDSGHLVFER